MEASPKIGFFIATLPEPVRKPGGADMLAHRAADALARRGHDVTVVSYSPKPVSAAYRHERLGPDVLARRRALRLLILPWLWHRGRPARFDVLHLYGVDWFFFARRRATVRTFPGSARQEARTATSRKRRWSQYLVFALELLAARLATATYSISGAEEPMYGARGILTCGIDIHPVAGARTGDVPVILFVGTWEGRKRGRLLAATFAQDVLPVLPDAELWMVSDRIEPGAGIRWFEHPTDEELGSLYRQATVFCLPSSYEGLGIPYLEAMAAGTPVVATDNPGARWVLEDGRDGLIADEDHLGSALVELLGDSTARQRLREAGRRRVDEFSWDAVCAAHVVAYTHAIDELRRRRRVRRWGLQ